jgi:catechol 2,3-dioxygenase-like lactoylglutathione lyase family enzyme
MLAGAHLVGFVATRDLAVAGAFYGDLLGLRRVAATPLANVYDVSGATLCLVRADDVEPTGQTLFAWSVDDLGATVARMRERGIELIDYPGLDQDADGAWTSPAGARVAWFNDPEGHILSIMQMPTAET